MRFKFILPYAVVNVNIWGYEGGSMVSTSNPVSVTMMGDVMVAAAFRQDEFDIYLPLVVKN